MLKFAEIKEKTKNEIDKLKTKYANGCTGVPDFNFTDCCNLHDIDYTLKEKSRFKADWHLFKCVKKARKNPIIAFGYFLGVRTLGLYWWYKAKK